MQAPTLVVVQGDKAAQYSGTNEIRKFIDQETQAREDFEHQEALPLG